MKRGGLMDFKVGEIAEIHKIKNGAKLAIGKEQTIIIIVDHYFNCFQKRMIKWCLGFTITDYSED